MEYELESSQKVFKTQFGAFRDDTGFIGIFKKNLHSEAEPHKIIGEEIIGVTKCGQLVKITFDGKKLRIEW